MKSIKDLFSMQGKVVFITGGAGYLGSAMCHALAELGADLVIASRDAEKCRAFAGEMVDTYGVRAEAVGVDITDIDSISESMATAVKTFGKIDVLINNAWSGKKNTFESISVEDWKYDIDVCLNGVFYCCKAAAPYLKESKGVIINTASMYGLVAPDYRLYDGEKYANPPSYGAAKAGVLQLTRYMASFLAPHGIRVNAVSPGPYPFPETQKARDFMERLEGKNMLGRIGQPEDLKGVVALLASDASSYMTGQNISVDGGWTSW